jgi:hypothetical protein
MRKLQLFGLILLAVAMLAMPSGASAQIAVGISVHIGPPAIPVYAQPICPGAGYMWTPGYWAYGDDGYYWVPGTWVMAPQVGFLWTPGYWGWGGGAYLWHAGYWGPHIGFYGGINYGFGYGGVGFVGGRWNGGVFAYNSAVMNVNTTVIHNTYIDKTVVVNNVNRVSYNGGEGGLTTRPTEAETQAANEHHIQPTNEQMQHEHTASTNRALLASANHGQPSIAATSKAGEFTGHGVVAASAASHYNAANSNRPPNASTTNHPNNVANVQKTDRPPSSGGSSGSNHPNNTNTSHANNTQANNTHANNSHPSNTNPPKNQSHSESKPENKPKNESKPHKD